MENLDVIILTAVVVISFVIFIVTSIKEFTRIKEEPYEFEKASGPTRAALFNALSSLFDEDEVSQEKRKKFKSTLERTISDMEIDGMYFDKKKETGSNTKAENNSDT